jgi:glycosyltransferase involved in cell wall biosynthesis
VAARPQISIVVPSFNHAHYLDETLRSILDQGYPGLELIVVDGGSKDGTVELLRRYSDRLAYWVSEPDRGQTHAINKGVARATGDVVAYVNSDDRLEPGSLHRVGQFFADNPSAEWLTGGCRCFGDAIETWYLHPEGWTALADTVLPWARAQTYVFPQSGASFMRRDLVRRLGEYDEALHYSMDMEYYARAAFAGVRMHIIPDVLAGWRWHPEAKSWTRGLAYAFRKDELTILARYLDRVPAGERPRARREYQRQSAEVVIREANYLIKSGSRYTGLRMLLGLPLRAPAWTVRRPWLGAVRRAVLGWRAGT